MKFDEAVKKAEVKSDFNDRVQEQRGESTVLEFPKFKPSVEYQIENADYSEEVWPTTFKYMPQAGDLVQSLSGRTLKINSITHKVGGILITLGRDLGDITPSGGGGYSEEDYL